MKDKYKNLPEINKEDFIKAISKLKVVIEVCNHFNINRHTYGKLLEKFDINPFDYYTQDELTKAVKRNKIQRSADNYHITKDILLNDVLTIKSFNKIMDKYNIKTKQVLSNLFDHFDINFDALIPKEDRIAIAIEHRKKTNLERYGVDNAAKSPEKIEKLKSSIKKTLSERGEEIKAKRARTNFKKYGATHIWQSEQTKQKIQDIYGTENAMSSEIVKKRLRDTNLKNHGYDYYTESPEFRVKAEKTKKENGSFARSKGEIEIEKYIRSIYDGKVIVNSWHIIENNELDIYLPDKYLAIEYNGSYWHSTEQKDKLYHYNKSMACRAKNIRLIHIYDWEWEDKRIQPIIKSVLSIALGVNVNRIYARECEIKEIDNPTYRAFVEENHLQGYRSAKIKLGLYYKDKLVQIMSFGHRIHQRKDKKDLNEWEIVRGCPGSNNLIVGGVSKLFAYFLREYNPKKVFSFGDLNKFDGNGYEAIGMKLIEIQKSNRWFIDIKTKKVSNWLYRSKEKREKLLKNSLQVYGAGNLVYVWSKDK